MNTYRCTLCNRHARAHIAEAAEAKMTKDAPGCVHRAILVMRTGTIEDKPTPPPKTPPPDLDCRRTYIIPCDYLKDLLSEGFLHDEYIRIPNPLNLPPGATVHQVWFSPEHMGWAMSVTHPSFDKVPLGAMAPSEPMRFTTHRVMPAPELHDTDFSVNASIAHLRATRPEMKDMTDAEIWDRVTLALENLPQA